MGNLLYLALAAGLSTVGALVLWLVRHRPRSMQHQMDAFSRELRALRPHDAQAQRSEAHLDRVEPLPIRPRAVSASSTNAAHRAHVREQSSDRRRSATES